MSMKSFLVDTSKCTGCRACQSACKKWNSLPAEETAFSGKIEYTNPVSLSAKTWTRVKFNRFGVNGINESWSLVHQKCNHCTDAECIKVCPEKALYKVDGWTVVDHDRCIGCGACEKRCPYGSVHVLYKPAEGMKSFKSYKCHACVPTGADSPRCVAACPTGALTFGQRMRIISTAKKREAELKKVYPSASVFGLEQYGGLNVITVFKDKALAPDGSRGNDDASGRTIGAHMIYACLKSASFGIPALKRKAWKISSSLSGHDEHNG